MAFVSMSLHTLLSPLLEITQPASTFSSPLRVRLFEDCHICIEGVGRCQGNAASPNVHASMSLLWPQWDVLFGKSAQFITPPPPFSLRAAVLSRRVWARSETGDFPVFGERWCQIGLHILPGIHWRFAFFRGVLGACQTLWAQLKLECIPGNASSLCIL